MPKTKRIMSGGLAFVEQKDMDTLRKMALKGWILKRFHGLGYEFEGGEPEDVTYNIDYRNLKNEDPDEYYELFEMAGWEHVCSDGTMHIFKAAQGTKPIYTDTETEKEKYIQLQTFLKYPTTICVIITMILFIGTLITEGLLLHVVSGLFIVLFIITIPMVFTYGAATLRIWDKSRRFVQ